MKIIGGRKYTERADLQNKIFGIEQYKPSKQSAKNLFFRVTSGTTKGIPTLVVLRIMSNKILSGFKHRHLLILHPKNGLKFQLAQTALTHRARRVLAPSKRDVENRLIYSAIGYFKPQSIYSLVSFLNFFVDKLYGKKVGAFPKMIKEINIAGETPSKSFLIKLRKMFRKSKVVARYTISEIGGPIGTHCGYLTRKYKTSAFRAYHPVKPVSIIKPNNAGVGEISVYTPELSHYLTGDAGKIIKEKCACGAAKILLMYGRVNYDIVNCVGAVFHASEVERVFSSLSDYLKDYFLEISEVFEKGKTVGSVVIKVVPTEKLQAIKNGEDFVCDFVRKNLQLTKTRCLGDLVNNGIFLSPKIVFVASLPHTDKKVRMAKMGL